MTHFPSKMKDTEANKNIHMPFRYVKQNDI